MIKVGVDARALRSLEGGIRSALACDADFCVVDLGDTAAHSPEKSPFFRPAADEGERECDVVQHLEINISSAAPSPEERLLALVANSRKWSSAVVGRVTVPSWDGDDQSLRLVEGQLRLAAFLGLPAVIVPELPCGDGAALAISAAASVISAHCAACRSCKVHVACAASSPSAWRSFSLLRRHLNMEPLCGGGESGSAAQLSPRAAWEVAKGRAVLQSVFPLLVAGSGNTAVCQQWLGEDVALFDATLCSSDKAFAEGMFRRRAWPIVDISPGPASASARVCEVRALSNDAVGRDVRRNQFADFEDVLELPLQPLGDHLPNPTYEVFEDDAAKYTQYYAAMLRHFTARSRTPVAVVVLGAGRGPLVTAALLAGMDAGCSVAVTAIEKNPDACAFLRLKLVADQQWVMHTSSLGSSVRVVEGDGRSLSSSDFPTAEAVRCDVLVSELLGSFGDNELSSECLNGFHAEWRRLQRLRYVEDAAGDAPFGPPTMVSVPSSFSSFIAPCQYSRGYDAVRSLELSLPTLGSPDASRFDVPYVVNATRYRLLSEPKRCFNFVWGDESQHKSGVDEPTTLCFSGITEATVHGAVGFFEAVLFQDDVSPDNSVTLSTVPDRRTPNMYSWFPLYFPTYLPVSIAADEEVLVDVARCGSNQKVWYEWRIRTGGALTLPDVQWSNRAGASAAISL